MQIWSDKLMFNKHKRVRLEKLIQLKTFKIEFKNY